MVLHDLLPTNTRLYRITLVETVDCTLCADTTIHRLTECGVGKKYGNGPVYGWRRYTERTEDAFPWLAPGTGFRLWPHLATLWILANLLFHLVHNRRTMTAEDYNDFLRKVRWKNYQEKKRCETVGNYLQIQDSAEPPPQRHKLGQVDEISASSTTKV